MAKRARKASSDSEEDYVKSKLPPKKARPATAAGRSTSTLENGSVTTAAGPSTSDTGSPRTIKIFNMNVNGVMKAFARREKRLDALLKEQG